MIDLRRRLSDALVGDCTDPVILTASHQLLVLRSAFANLTAVRVDARAQFAEVHDAVLLRWPIPNRANAKSFYL